MLKRNSTETISIEIKDGASPDLANVGGTLSEGYRTNGNVFHQKNHEIVIQHSVTDAELNKIVLCQKTHFLLADRFSSVNGLAQTFSRIQINRTYMCKSFHV